MDWTQCIMYTNSHAPSGNTTDSEYNNYYTDQGWMHDIV